MHNRSVWGALAIAVLVIAIATAIGMGAYNAGMAQGLAQAGQAVAAAPPAAPPAGAQYVYVWPRRGGFHFGFFPWFGFLFLFLAFRALFWGGRWGYRRGWGGGHGYYGGVPPAFDEWHRRAHGQQPPSPPPAGTTV